MENRFKVMPWATAVALALLKLQAVPAETSPGQP
jgi:hypothetical protein